MHRKEYVRFEEEVVDGKRKPVTKKDNPFALGREENSNKKRAATSPERPSSSVKEPRMMSPMLFDDVHGFMDTTDIPIPCENKDKGKAGKVGFFGMVVFHCSDQTCTESE